ncbi:MAG: rhodanese-like domain-containing protein [Chloroflexota bacterium]
MGILKKIFGGKKEAAVPPTPANPTPSPPPEPEPEPMEINEISPDELKARIDQGDELIVVDMRQSFEYQAGHIPGAMHMFIQDIPTRANELPKDTDIVFQCWHGNSSLQASAFLIDNGWDANRVSSLSGGIAGWAQVNGQESMVQD